MNDVVVRALNSILVPTRVEPTGLLSGSNLKPDGISLTPWASGKPLAWDVTCAFPLATSWSSLALRDGAAVATAAEDRKRMKYEDLTSDFHFEPVSLEIFGGMGESTARFVAKLGARIASKVMDQNALSHLRQRLALSVQISNSACVLETLPGPGAPLLPEL